jgi:protein involved in polysaccharide export with SLBB domain
MWLPDDSLFYDKERPLTAFRSFVSVPALRLAFLAALSAMTAVVGQARAQDGYLVNIGDVLELDILGDSEIAQRFVVGNDGAIQLPFVGGLQVRGLPLEVARAAVRDVYIERQIFVDPAVELSIAAYRPVFVLGDVRSPGYFEYQLFLSPEKALGLAGGPTVTVANVEARILERRSLEGARASTEMDLARTAMEFARIQAQLRGDKEIRTEEIPSDVSRYVNEADFEALKQNENAIIELELLNHNTQKSLLSATITEAEIEIELLKEREAAQVVSVERVRVDLARSEDLEARGVQTATALSESYRRAEVAEDQLLQIRTQQSTANRRLSDLQRDMVRLESERQQRFVTERQDAFIRLSKLQSDRSSILDRLELLRQWSESWASTNLEARIEYRVRRRTTAEVETLDVKATDELLPGDLLIVTVSAPEGLSELDR